MRPFTIVALLGAYLPFEELFLGILPVSDFVYSFSRFGSELVLYGLVLFVGLGKVARKEKVFFGPVLVLVAALAGLSIVSTFLNQGSMLGMVVNLRSFLRYAFLFLLVINIPVSKRDVSFLLRLLLAAGTINGVLAVVQYYGGPSVTALFIPRASELEIAGHTKEWIALAQGLKMGSVTGTFGAPTPMAAFMLVALVIAITVAYERRTSLFPGVWNLVRILLIAFGIFATYKRAALAIGVLVPFLVFFLLQRRDQLIKLGFLYFFAIPFFFFAALLVDLSGFEGPSRAARTQEVPVGEYLAQLFTKSYWERSESQSRLWVVTQVGGYLLSRGTLIGFGADEQVVREKLAEGGGELSRILVTGGFEDVYWIAMYAYYGVLGVFLFLLIIYLNLRQAKRLRISCTNCMPATIGTVTGALLIILVLYSFVVRAPELRTFSYYFWLFAALPWSYAYWKPAMVGRRRFVGSVREPIPEDS